MTATRRSTFGDARIIAPHGVYTPRSDTELLASELRDVRDADVLELCAGSGALAVTVSKRGARRVVAADRSRRALLTVRANARLNNVDVEARRGDLYDVVRDGERFDLIVANPPYLPTGDDCERPDMRWDGGPDGRLILDRIIDGASAVMNPGARLVFVQSDLAGIQETSQRLRANNLEIVRKSTQRGAFGPIVAARRQSLVRSGALAADTVSETLVAFTARSVGHHPVRASTGCDANVAFSDRRAGRKDH